MYYESARGLTITQARAIQELKRHGITVFDMFFKDLGNKGTYNAGRVLQWLGY